MAADPIRTPTRTAARIVRQLADRLDGHGPSGDAFVVSVYGEWGIGKTRCLHDVREAFRLRLAETLVELPQKVADRITVPVFFDPWQYEHEDHLVVPLLKTIERTLVTVAAQIDAAGEPGRDATLTGRRARVGDALKSAGSVFGDVAVSLLSGFRFKFAPLKEVIGIEVELNPKDALEAARKADEKRAADRAPAPKPTVWQRFMGTPPAPASAAGRAETSTAEMAQQRLAVRESLYFDVRTALASLTQGAAPQLRLVVLIDDLDRCLPEKAIQVLESVKLFVNVPGFSFVLAVDDEVVERGIAHRYRAYLPAADKADGDAQGTGSAPISGAEYLEKIVHLPVHLQRWTPDEADGFLRTTYPKLFAPPAPAPGDATGQGPPAPQRSEDLLQLVLNALPLVPRKLIRLAEALEFQHQHFDDLGALDLWQPLHAARVVVLQQLYPALYRHLRLGAGRYWRLFDMDRNPYGDPAIAGGKSLDKLRNEFLRRGEAIEPADPAASEQRRAQTSDLREQLTLLDLVEQAGRQRGAPDPLRLFAVPRDSAERDPKNIGSGLTLEAFARLYIHGVELAAARPVAAATSGSEAEPLATVRNFNRLLAMLTSADAVSRREYLEAEEVLGKRLPDDLFASLLQSLQQPEAEAKLTDMAWLRDIAALTSAEQLLRLYREHDVLARVQRAEQGVPR